MTNTNPSSYSTPARYKWSFIIKVLAPVLIFWGLQGLTQVVIMAGDVAMHVMQEGEGSGQATQWIAQDAIGISLLTLVISSLLTIAILAKMGIGIARTQWVLPNAKELVGYIALLLCLMAWVDLLLSILDLPDWNNQLMYGLMKSPWGIFSITLLGPIAEEFVFRGGVTERLLSRVKPAVAIGLSALVFGLVHVNPPQVIGAGLLGALLAHSYIKTRSLWIPVILHVINNSMAVGLSLYTDNKTESLRTLVSNDSDIMSYAVFLLIAALIGAGGVYMIRTAKK